jgi:RNA polymerase sigma-70 factor (ECF subfamily)
MSETANDRSGELLARWRAGDQHAAAELVGQYTTRLVALARSRLPTKFGHRVDAEDVVQSAYRSFFAAARDGRYDRPQGGDLWQLLVTITLRKVYRQMEQLGTCKRAVDRELHFGSEDSLWGIQGPVSAGEPSPVEALALVDEVQDIMRGLDAAQRRVLELRLQGHNLDEIATATRCSERTVRRLLEKLKLQLEHRAGDSAIPDPRPDGSP